MSNKIPPKGIVQYAINMANRSPCEKSKRGAVVFSTDNNNFRVQGAGFNRPAPPLKCLKGENCRPICNKICIHAEMEAMLQTMGDKEHPNTTEFDILHIKTVKGKPVTSGPPSCWQCSRHIVNYGIRGVWLFHEKGWKYYPSLEFHTITLKNCGLIL